MPKRNSAGDNSNTDNNSQTFRRYSTEEQQQSTPAGWKKIFVGVSVLLLIAIGIGIYLAASSSRVADKKDSTKKHTEAEKFSIGTNIEGQSRLRTEDENSSWADDGDRNGKEPFWDDVLMCGSSQSKTKKSAKVRKARIVGGMSEKHPDRYPWMARITLFAYSQKKVFACGGSVIDDLHILTAAQCIPPEVVNDAGFVFFDDVNLDMTIGLGATDSENNSYNASSQVGYVHQGFFDNAMITDHDIAVLLLNNSLTNAPGWLSTIKPVGLAAEGQNMPRVCEVSGWGAFEVGFDSPMSRKLRKLFVSVYGFKKCRLLEPYSTSLKNFSFLFGEETLCSDTGMFGNRDVCLGDSGGPLVCEVEEAHPSMVLFGVISATASAAPCGRPKGYASTYSNVAFYRSWLTCIAVPALRNVGKTITQLGCLRRECFKTRVPSIVTDTTWEQRKGKECPIYASYINCLRLERNPVKCRQSIVPSIFFVDLKNGTVTWHFRKTLLATFESIKASVPSSCG